MESQVLNELTELRHMLDELFEYTHRTQIESKLFLECDDKINLIKGLYMNEQIKKEVE